MIVVVVHIMHSGFFCTIRRFVNWMRKSSHRGTFGGGVRVLGPY